MKTAVVGMAAVLFFSGYVIATESFTKPRKEKKVADAQVREQCCRDVGTSVKSCAALHRQLADIEECGLSLVEHMVDGQSCSLMQKKGQELKTAAVQVQEYNQRLQELAHELEGYTKLLKSMQATP